MSESEKPALPADIFLTVFEKSPGSLLVKADPPRFTICAASDMYLDVTSSTREHIVGRGFFEVFPEDEARFDASVSARRIFNKVIQKKDKIEVPRYRFDVRNPQTGENEVHYWSCCNAPIMDDAGGVAYILNTVVDITPEVKAKETAIENENRLRLAAEAATFATWELDLRTQEFIYSPRLAEIFGHQADTPVTLQSIRNQVDIDDMQNIILKAFHESMITGKYLYEVRVHWPDESVHWIRTQGMVLYDDKNEPVRMLGTILDITESKRDEARKNDFVAMASHELKTPLTSIKAYIQLLMQKLDPMGDGFVTGALSKVDVQVNKMTDLIHGFLDLSKREPGKLQLKRSTFDMVKLVEDTITDNQATCRNHVISFDAGAPLTVTADKNKIGEVLSNFLSNAAKYSDKGTRITIAAGIEEGYVQVSVTDEGIGIPAKDQKKLFQRFYRVENERMRNISGFGIGLYLSSEIIQRHKGKIWFESQERKGSTFYFSLPQPAAK